MYGGVLTEDTSISCSDEHEVIGTGRLANAAIPKEEGDSRSYSYSQIYISTLPTRPLLVAVGGPSLFLHRNGSQTLPPINVNVFVHRWSQRTISDTESQQPGASRRCSHSNSGGNWFRGRGERPTAFGARPWRRRAHPATASYGP